MGLMSLLFGGKPRGDGSALMLEIRNDSNPNCVVYKHPAEEFNTKSHLFLNDNEVALFVKTKGDGGHDTLLMTDGGTLNTNNYPFFTDITKRFTGGKSIFYCAIYFIRTHTYRSVLWGTESPIGPFVHNQKYTFNLMANGTYDFYVNDPKALMQNFGYSGIKTVSLEDLRMQLNAKVSNFVKMKLTQLFKDFGSDRIKFMEYVFNEANMFLENGMNREFEDSRFSWGIKFSNFTLNVSDTLGEINESINKAILKKETEDIQGRERWIAEQIAKVETEKAKQVDTVVGMNNYNAVRVKSTNGSSASELVEAMKSAFDSKGRLQQLKELYELGLIDEDTYRNKVSEIVKDI